MTVVSLATYCISVSITIVVYDHITTISDEFRLFWRRPLSGGAGMYFFIKYVLLLSNLYFLCMLPKGYNSVQSCAQAEEFLFGLGIVELFLPGVFMSLRAYALSKSKCLGLLMFLLHLVPIGINVAYNPQGLTGLVDDGHCYLFDDGTNAQRSIVVSWTSLILADLLGIATIWRARSTTYRVRGTFLFTVLLRDGIVSFSAHLALNVLRLALSALPTDGFFKGSSYVSIIASPLVCILVTRGLMNLQAAYQRTTEWDTDNVLHVIDEGVAVDGDYIQTDESQSTSFALVDRSET